MTIFKTCADLQQAIIQLGQKPEDTVEYQQCATRIQACEVERLSYTIDGKNIYG